MTTQQASASFQIVDARGEVSTYEQPLIYDDAVTTLANLITWVQQLGVHVDLVTDGAITKIRLSLLIPLPAGIKSSAVAGSDNEKTGLTTLQVNLSPNAFGIDTPAIPNALLSGNQIDQTNANWLSWKNYLITASTAIQATDRYGNAFTGVVKHAVLTFRKHRRALRRA